MGNQGLPTDCWPQFTFPQTEVKGHIASLEITTYQHVRSSSNYGN